jgi:predicted transcriptional regulator
MKMTTFGKIFKGVCINFRQRFHGMMASELVKGFTIPAPVAVSKDDTVLMLGALLSSWDVSSTIVTDKGKVIGAVYGFQLVSYLINSPNEELFKRLLLPIGQVVEGLGLSQIPSLSQSDRFDSLMKKIASNEFGDVILTNDSGHPVGVLSLTQVISSLALKKKKVNMKVRDVATKLELAAEEQPLLDALRYMMRNRIRRTIIKRKGKFYGLTEREILRAFFSLDGLQSLHDDPQKFLTSSLGQLVGGRAKQLPRVNGHIHVHEAWRYLKGDPNTSLIVDHDRVATPWDLVMKPYFEGKLLA